MQKRIETFQFPVTDLPVRHGIVTHHGILESTAALVKGPDRTSCQRYVFSCKRVLSHGIPLQIAMRHFGVPATKNITSTFDDTVTKYSTLCRPKKNTKKNQKRATW